MTKIMVHAKPPAAVSTVRQKNERPLGETRDSQHLAKPLIALKLQEAAPPHSGKSAFVAHA